MVAIQTFVTQWYWAGWKSKMWDGAVRLWRIIGCDSDRQELASELKTKFPMHHTSWLASSSVVQFNFLLHSQSILVWMLMHLRIEFLIQQWEVQRSQCTSTGETKSAPTWDKKCGPISWWALHILCENWRSPGKPSSTGGRQCMVPLNIIVYALVSMCEKDLICYTCMVCRTISVIVFHVWKGVHLVAAVVGWYYTAWSDSSRYVNNEHWTCMYTV